jgi:type II secretory pathway pseudopilin PulG
MTLTEMLIVIMIVATLIAILLPGLGAALVAANITQVRSDFKQIQAALSQYMSYIEQLPPTRKYTTASKYDLDYCMPPELFPADLWGEGNNPGGKGYLEVVLEDPFQALRSDSLNTKETDLARGYRYKALVGLSVNGAAPAALTTFRVPEDFPESGGSKKNYSDFYESPVRIIIWSAGPNGPPVNKSYSADGVDAEDPANWYPEKANGIVCLYYTGKDWEFSY